MISKKSLILVIIVIVVLGMGIHISQKRSLQELDEALAELQAETEDRPFSIVETRVKILNDGGKSPSVEEVKALLVEMYGEEDGKQIQVKMGDDEIFTIRTPEIESNKKEPIYLDSKGIFKAFYGVERL